MTARDDAAVEAVMSHLAGCRDCQAAVLAAILVDEVEDALAEEEAPPAELEAAWECHLCHRVLHALVTDVEDIQAMGMVIMDHTYSHLEAAG